MRTGIRSGPDAALRQEGRTKSTTCTLVVCRAALQKPKTRETLKDPARIGARASVSVEVQDCGGSLSLENYMRLPVEQYYELDPDLIVPRKGNRFGLMVPRVHLLGVWLEPRVEVVVVLDPSGECVTITASECHLRGSDLVERLRLDERFCISFTTRLTWTSAPPPRPYLSSDAAHERISYVGTAGSAASEAAIGEETANGSGGLLGVLSRIPLPFGGPSRVLEAAPAQPQSQIHGHAELEVWSEVLPPFNVMPRSALTAAGDAVMGQLMRTLLPLFMHKLAGDYLRWATDEMYRQRRASQLRLAQPR